MITVVFLTETDKNEAAVSQFHHEGNPRNSAKKRVAERVNDGKRKNEKKIIKEMNESIRKINIRNERDQSPSPSPSSIPDGVDQSVWWYYKVTEPMSDPGTNYCLSCIREANGCRFKQWANVLMLIIQDTKEHTLTSSTLKTF